MKSRIELEAFGKRILNETRTELYLAMHFMARALDSLDYTMDLNTRRCGTDARSIHFNPQFLFALFVESPQKLDRLYLHMLLHCLFRHMFTGDGRDPALWNLVCDIQTESVLDSMDYEIIRRPPGAFREEWYQRLQAELRVLTAERLYQYFLENNVDIDTMARLKQEFLRDDHAFWAPFSENTEDNAGDSTPPDLPEDMAAPENESDAPKTEAKQKKLRGTQVGVSWMSAGRKMRSARKRKWKPSAGIGQRKAVLYPGFYGCRISGKRTTRIFSGAFPWSGRRAASIRTPLTTATTAMVCRFTEICPSSRKMNSRRRGRSSSW